MSYILSNSFKSFVATTARDFVADEDGAVSVDLVVGALMMAGIGTGLASTFEMSGNSIGKTMQKSAAHSSITLVGAGDDDADDGQDNLEIELTTNTLPAGCTINDLGQMSCSSS
ncbi:MAG: hypothetical protein GKR98_01265 [Boseongicola sp.]|nr:MAG: hypothetical protein GKR98_01265 [Boseongicola sp.]